jgi:hypothetical protein
MKSHLFRLALIASALTTSHTMAKEIPRFPPATGSQQEASGSPTSASAVNLAVKKKVEELKSNITVAVERLDKANKGTHQDRLKELDALIGDVKKALAEVGPGGQVYDKLAESIKITDAMAADVRAKMTDATKSAETQSKYQTLVRAADTQKNKLYQSQMAMNSARAMLEDRVKMLEENKELVVDFARLEQLEEANKAVIEVVKSMNGVTTELDKLVSDIANVNAPKPLP